VIFFGFLIVALSTYQATVVPDQNRQVEFLHNQEVQTDMVELSSSIAATGRTGDAAPATVNLGTRYPSRTFFVNPPPASGRLSTNRSVGAVSLSNVTVLKPDGTVDSEANDYWEVDPGFDTAFVEYEPRYSNYRDAPTTRYESGVLFNRFPSGAALNLPNTGQQVIDDNRITLVVVKGNLSATGVDAASIDPSAVSVTTRRERITGNATITIPSTRNVSAWRSEKLLNVAENDFVDAVRDGPSPDTVTIELDDSKTYSLGVTVMSAGSQTVDQPDPAYIAVERAPTTVTSGTTREVVVEVRDTYGNPVDAENVIAGTNGSGTFADETLTTDEDGQATFEYTPSAAEDEELQFSVTGLAGFDASTPLDANVTVEVNGGSGGGGGAVEPDKLAVVGTPSAFDTNGDSVTGGVSITLENTGTSTVRLTNVRIRPLSSHINGLSDEAPGEGVRQSELSVASTSEDGYSDVQMTVSQFAYVDDGGVSLY
jgi:hypothetical protein